MQKKMTFDEIKVGDVFVDSWGYSMVLYDFYKVIGKTTASLKLQKLQKNRIGGDGWNPRVVPSDVPDGKPITKRFNNGSVKIDDYNYMFFYNPVTGNENFTEDYND